MKKSKRFLIFTLAAEIFHAALMLLLFLTVGQNSAETARRIGTSLGGIMGAFGAFGLFYSFLLWRSGE